MASSLVLLFGNNVNTNVVLSASVSREELVRVVVSQPISAIAARCLDRSDAVCYRYAPAAVFVKNGLLLEMIRGAACGVDVFIADAEGVSTGCNSVFESDYLYSGGYYDLASVLGYLYLLTW